MNTKYVMPMNVSTVAEYLNLMIKRKVFVDLLTDKEVCDMTMAQFSRDDILIYQGREEGREEGMEEGEIKGVIRTYKKLGIASENVRRCIMEEYQKSGEEADRLIEKYWK